VDPGLNVGGTNFGWLAVWVLSPDWLIRKSGVMRLLSGDEMNPHAWRREMRVVPQLYILDLGIGLTTEGKLRKNLSQVIRKALG